MAKPQITGVVNPNTRIVEQWWFVPSPVVAGATDAQLLQYRDEAHKAFVGLLPEGATANALEVFGQVASEKPPGASEEYGAGWWFKPKTPLFGPTTRPPAVGAFDTIDDLRTRAKEMFGAAVKDMPMSDFVKKYENQIDGYRIAPQPGGKFNFALPDKMPPGSETWTDEQRERYNQEKTKRQQDIDIGALAIAKAEREAAGGMTAAGFRPETAAAEDEIPADAERRGTGRWRLLLQDRP